MSFLISVDAEEFKAHPDHERLSQRSATLVDKISAWHVYHAHSLGRGDDGRIYFEPEHDESSRKNLALAIEALLPQYANFLHNPPEQIVYTLKVHFIGRSTDIPENIRDILKEESHWRFVHSD